MPRPPPSSSSSWSLILFTHPFSTSSSPFLLLLLLAICCGSFAIGDEEGWGRAERAKRQYYDDSYYGSYYGWQAGRIVGWLIGFLVLLLFICLPCVCCLGIWFLGWFGLRQAMANRRARRARDEGRVVAARDQHEISRRYHLDSPAGGEQRYHDPISQRPIPMPRILINSPISYVYATDRVYAAERRPRTPPVVTVHHGHHHEGTGGAYASNGVVGTHSHPTRETRRL